MFVQVSEPRQNGLRSKCQCLTLCIEVNEHTGGLLEGEECVTLQWKELSKSSIVLDSWPLKTSWIKLPGNQCDLMSPVGNRFVQSPVATISIGAHEKWLMPTSPWTLHRSESFTPSNPTLTYQHTPRSHLIWRSSQWWVTASRMLLLSCFPLISKACIVIKQRGRWKCIHLIYLWIKHDVKCITLLSMIVVLTFGFSLSFRAAHESVLVWLRAEVLWVNAYLEGLSQGEGGTRWKHSHMSWGVGLNWAIFRVRSRDWGMDVRTGRGRIWCKKL